MARATAAKTVAMSEALEVFLRTRPQPDHDTQLPNEPRPAGSTPRADGPAPGPQTEQPDHAPASQAEPASSAQSQDVLRLPHPDWLPHRLTVTGPMETVAAFQGAAAGTGVVPWQLDLSALEEDWFHLLIKPAPRSLSLRGARILAEQLREAVERRHSLAVARVGHSRACPFDLHALVPVPPALRRLGPDHPDSLLRRQLLTRAAMANAADWLQQRDQLGCHVFCPGGPKRRDRMRRRRHEPAM